MVYHLRSIDLHVKAEAAKLRLYLQVLVELHLPKVQILIYTGFVRLCSSPSVTMRMQLQMLIESATRNARASHRLGLCDTKSNNAITTRLAVSKAVRQHGFAGPVQ